MSQWIEQLNRDAARNHPTVLKIMLSQDHTSQIAVTGAPGRYILQSSTNLQSWRAVQTNVTADGSFSVINPAEPNTPVETFRTEE